MSPKLIHISDDAAHKLNVIRDRRDCSYSEAILWMAEKRKREERVHDAQKEAGATR